MQSGGRRNESPLGGLRAGPAGRHEFVATDRLFVMAAHGPIHPGASVDFARTWHDMPLEGEEQLSEHRTLGYLEGERGNT